ncbi:hypothetical protein [Streptomyces capoamus]|uniref:hypothetical protein n=1 Tax=Streptomyces capoamus TaxID=68183 RepID=UPI0033921559
MPVSRATHEALKTAHFALKAKYRQAISEQQAGRTSDEATAATITRLTTEASELRRIMASHIRGLEREGWFQTADLLRGQLASAGLDLTAELASGWKPGEGALPAKRTYTAAESRLLAEVHRRNQACGSLETQLLEQQSINQLLNIQLREYRETPAAVDGSAA